jgi:hypothetical protein
MEPGGKELVAFGRKPADHDQLAFRGIHALHSLILLDEACGVPKSIFDAVDALATNSNGRMLAIGMDDMRNRGLPSPTVPMAWPSPSLVGRMLRR